MLIDRTSYLSEKHNIKHMKMIKNAIEKEIKGIKIGNKKQFTNNQVIQLYENLYNKIAYNIELEEQF
jgi:hypothetical protein